MTQVVLTGSSGLCYNAGMDEQAPPRDCDHRYRARLGVTETRTLTLNQFRAFKRLGGETA